jgi:hypothetical protein
MLNIFTLSPAFKVENLDLVCFLQAVELERLQEELMVAK